MCTILYDEKIIELGRMYNIYINIRSAKNVAKRNSLHRMHSMWCDSNKKKIKKTRKQEICNLKAPKQRLTFEIHSRRCSQSSQNMQELCKVGKSWINLRDCIISKGLSAAVSKRGHERLPLRGAWKLASCRICYWYCIFFNIWQKCSICASMKNDISGLNYFLLNNPQTYDRMRNCLELTHPA